MGNENIIIDEKTCTKCNTLLPIACFSKNKLSRDGHRSQCKTCQSQYGKEYVSKNRDKVLKSQREYWARNRSDISERRKARYRENPQPAIERSKRYYRENREVVLEKQREYSSMNSRDIVRRVRKWRDENRELYLLQLKRYRTKNRRKIKDTNHRYNQTPKGRASIARKNHRRRSLVEQTVNDLTAEQWEMILRKQKNRCVGCRERFTKDLPPTRDHVIPLSKGGGLTVSNVVALCRSCNSVKSDRDAEYVAQVGLV